jgi:adenylyltransferase/sulfurtransferase
MMERKMQYDRYQRQLILKGFGAEAQHKLRDAKVLVIGAGGLGCPLLQYLVAAGVGHIGLADHDVVSVSNLHRQILFGMEDVGQAKVDVAKKKMASLNPEVNIKTWREKWNQQLCIEHFPDYDIIVDATDNFASRYMINDACVLFGKPLVFGAVSQFDGQVACFNYQQENGDFSVNYRDLFPDPPANGEVLNCAEGGVLGVLPGIIGSMQAAEVIKWITGLGKPLANRLWNYNALTQEVFMLQLSDNPQGKSKLPQSVDAFSKMDYEWLCGIPQMAIKELDILEWKENHLGGLFVDIREPHEQPKLDGLSGALGLSLVNMPLSQLESNLHTLTGNHIVFVCQAGRRSLQAASILMKQNSAIEVYSLKGGVNALIESKMI